MSLTFVNDTYDWKNLSLIDFLKEGHIPIEWKNFFESNIENLNKISDFIDSKKTENIIYPPIKNVFKAFISPDKIKVVILGQDPYHNGSAVGYCFSVLSGNNINPSLRNIYKELKANGYNNIKEDGDISHWAKQGCFLLNTSLTVEKSIPDSHTNIWNDFTNNVIKYLANNYKNLVWLLMGSKAHYFQNLIDFKNNKVICTSHPSPFSAHRNTKKIQSFFGSNCFNEINSYLEKVNKSKIVW